MVNHTESFLERRDQLIRWRLIQIGFCEFRVQADIRQRRAQFMRDLSGKADALPPELPRLFMSDFRSSKDNLSLNDK